MFLIACTHPSHHHCRVPLGKQSLLLFRRAWLQNLRDKATNVSRAMSNVSSAAIFGSIFWRLGRSQASVQNRMGLLQVWPLLVRAMLMLSVSYQSPHAVPQWADSGGSCRCHLGLYLVGHGHQTLLEGLFLMGLAESCHETWHHLACSRQATLYFLVA